MLHLRLITPAERTDEVVRLIEDTVGTAHLAVIPGAARDPAGDLVLCDVAREAGDGLIAGLRHLGLDDTGAIAVEEIGRPCPGGPIRPSGTPRARARTRCSGRA